MNILQRYFHKYVACLVPTHYNQYCALETICGSSPNYARPGVQGVKMQLR